MGRAEEAADRELIETVSTCMVLSEPISALNTKFLGHLRC